MLNRIRFGTYICFGMMALAVITAGIVVASEPANMEAPKDFTLKTYDGKQTFQLSKNKADYVALHFLLKTECPICLRYTNEYHANAKKFPNVTHIFIKPDDPKDVQSWMSKLDTTNGGAPVIYHDPNAQLAKKYGIPHGYKFHGEVVNYPALILLDKNGKEIFRYVGTKTQDRFFYPKFEKKMKSMR